METRDIDGAVLEIWTPAETLRGLAEGRVVVIDVRTPQEYMFEHIEGALLMPLAFFRPEALPGQSEKRIVLHCGSGGRSEKAARAAFAAGIPAIAHIGTGFKGWKADGLPHIGTDMATGAPKRMAGSASGG